MQAIRRKRHYGKVVGHKLSLVDGELSLLPGASCVGFYTQRSETSDDRGSQGRVSQIRLTEHGLCGLDECIELWR